MKKVLLLSDQEHLPQGSMEWASALNKQEKILLVGVFLQVSDHLSRQQDHAAVPDGRSTYNNQAMAAFEHYCTHNDIEYRVHPHGAEFTTEAIRKETRFADLLIFSNVAFYEHLEPSLVNEYTEYAIHNTECPVLLIPEHFQQPENVILAYDGSPSSVFAIRQFIQTLPEMTTLDTLLVCMSEDNNALPEKDYIEELAARHFHQLTFFKANIDAQEHFTDWLADRTDTLLVCGAFGRTNFSRLFHKSFISGIVSAHKMPVFIAHK